MNDTFLVKILLCAITHEKNNTFVLLDKNKIPFQYLKRDDRIYNTISYLTEEYLDNSNLLYHTNVGCFDFINEIYIVSRTFITKEWTIKKGEWVDLKDIDNKLNQYVIKLALEK